MHLKSLTLKGFKSFAQPTTFVFEPGVTCVVGPNGSGKSNVVDAIAWVMGEQGAKTLRGGSMEDVIFAGTASKAPLGRAEVLLTIDNSDGALPIDYTEVTISRTLFRNGGSEYAINKEPCRLLDVQELLSDSGLGREMHVIVGQGQLDQVLHASADERRRFIEEAAGILKHRRRKEKTQRKLESMQANLTRLNDLAGEIRRQLTPLGRQAEIARKAQTIQAIVRDAKARVLADDVVALGRAIDDFQLSEQGRAAERATLADQLDNHRRRIAELESASSDDSLDRARRVSFSLNALLERVVALESIATERAGAWEEEGSVGGELATVTDEQLAQASRAVDQVTSDVAALEEALGQVSAELATEKASLAVLEEELHDLTQAALAFEAHLRELEAAIDLHAGLVEAAEADLQRQTQALERAQDRQAAAQVQLAQVESPGGDQPDLVTAAAEEVLREAQAALEKAEATEVGARGTVHQQEREREALAARVAALELALRSDESDQAIESESGITGRVATALKITDGYETAIATALGSLADALVVSSRKDATRLVARHHSDPDARIELVLGSGDAPSPVAVDGLTPAIEVVTGPAGVLALLSKTYVAEDTDAATAAWGRAGNPTGMTIVTREGDVFTEHTVRTGRGKAPSRLELQAERDRAHAQLSQVATALERAAFDQEQAIQARQAAQEALQDALSRLRDADSKRAEIGEAISGARAARVAADEEVARIEAGVTDAQGALEAARTAKAAKMDEYQLALQAPRPSVDDTARLAALARIESLTAKDVDARIALESARERLRAAQSASEALVQRREDERAQAQREAQRAVERRERQGRAREILQVLPLLLEQVKASLEEASQELIQEESRRESRTRELQEARAAEAQVRERLSAITDSVHSLEMQIYEKKLQRQTLLDRVSDELGLDEQTLIAEYAPDVPVPADPGDESEAVVPFDRAAQEARLAKAQRTLDQLGRVNPLALEEFQALETRHQFLREQLDDLHKARADLEAIMADLDQTMHTIFHDAFVDTQRAFDEVFPLLFPGGAGSLSLTDPDELLTTGIEVAVRPAGKKIERLSLLSGGERSLAAVALLIAIFKARPSPFYILDEVEAALDDANLGRLLQVMESLREGSQLIIITHQKRTMEIADALYGVSMRKDGVSAVVGQRVRDAEAYAS